MYLVLLLTLWMLFAGASFVRLTMSAFDRSVSIGSALESVVYALVLPILAILVSGAALVTALAGFAAVDEFTGWQASKTDDEAIVTAMFVTPFIPPLLTMLFIWPYLFRRARKCSEST